VFFGQQGLLYECVVRVNWGCDDDCVYLRMIDDILDILREFKMWVLQGKFATSIRLCITANDNLTVGRGVEIADEIGPPITQAGNAYFDVQGIPPFKSTKANFNI